MSAMGLRDCLSIGAALLIAGVAASSAVQRFLSARPLVFLGKVSFPLYLLHLPLLLSVGAGVYCLLHASLSRLGACGVAAAATLTASLVLAWVGSLTLEPLAIWSGRVVERWLGQPGTRPEMVQRVPDETEAGKDSLPSVDIRLIETTQTEHGGT